MSAADFLLTLGMQKVLGLAFAEPERSFTLNELIACAGGGHGNSQRQIERLIEAGVLEEGSRRGRQRSIKANTGYFLYPELRSIALKTFALAEPLRAALKPFERQIEEAFVFGSVAKGNDTQRSDIDLVVIGEAALMALTSAMFEVEQSIGRTVHLNLYNSAEWVRLKQSDPVLSQISEASKIRIFPRATLD